MQWDIGIELSETAVRLATREKGVVFTAPSAGAMRGDSLIALGEEALALSGRAPRDVRVSRPIHAGAIADARLTAQWLARLMEPFAASSRLRKPGVLLADSGLLKPGEWELIERALLELGAGQVKCVRIELLSALGAGLPASEPEGRLVLGAGAGLLFCSLIAYDRIVTTRSLPYGFSRIDDELAVLLRQRCALSVGQKACEELKLSLASALPARDIQAGAIGLNLRTGFPDEVQVPAALVCEAAEPVVQALISLAQSTIALAPDELCADLLSTGITLTGGGARLSGLDERIAAACGLPCHVCDAPETAVITGMARYMQK